MSTIIFCPNCAALILDAPRCPHCGTWERPAAAAAGRGAVAWRTTLPAGLASSLTLAEGTLYACDTAGKLHALDAATGKPAWPQPADLGDWRVHRQVAVAGGLVIVGPTDGRNIPQADKAVLLLDAATGAVQRRYPLAARQVSDPLVAGATIFVATSDGYAMALALADGAVCWRAPITGWYQAAPGLAGDLVVYGGDKGTLTALHAADGSPARTFTVEPDPQWGGSFPYPPAYGADGAVYVTCWDRRCYALDAATGVVVWASEPIKRPPMTPPLVTGDAVYFCGHDRYVHCLERGTGKGRWRTQLPRLSKTTPALIEGRLYVGSEDHRVYELNPETGALASQPLLETPRHIAGDWASDGERIYLADGDGNLFALIVAVRKEETDPLRLEASGKWEEAAARHALGGNLCRAAEIYRDQIREPRGAALLFERGGEPGPAAAMYEQTGDHKTARRLYREARRFTDAGRLSEELGDLAGAAQDYEAASQPEQAARFYTQLGLWAPAASLLERAAEVADERGDTAHAHDLRLQAADIYYQHLRQPDKAVMLYREAGASDKISYIFTHERDYNLWRFAANLMAPERAAAAYAERGYFVQAAEAYLRAGRPADAGALYQKAGEYALACDSFLRAGQPASAAAAMELAGNPAEAARLYEQADEPAKAAALYEQAGNRERAAALLEQVEDWPAAARLWASTERWDRAAHAWEQAAAFRQAADSYLKLNRCFEAAECIWRAAQASQMKGEAPKTTAALYEDAMAYYAGCGADDKAQECDLLRRWLRRQPWLEVPLPQVEEFVEGDSGRIEVIVYNKGWGMAREVSLAISGQFEPDTTRADKSFNLQDGLNKRQVIWVAPKRSGREVPLHLRIAYRDADSTTMPPLEISYEIRVHSKDERRGDSTPVIVQAGGKIIQMGAGDYVEDGQVKIQRGAAATAPREVVVGASPEPRLAYRLTCPSCGTTQPADRPKCQNAACAMPFIRCASCGNYQPARARFCLHCQAEQS